MPARAVHRTARILVVSLAAVAGCGGPSSDRPEDASDSAWLDIPPAVVIGVDAEDPRYLFGDVRSIAASREGVVYVGDRIGATVRAYSADGEFLAEVANEGEGPGEIAGWPAALTLGAGGRLFVRDASRVTVFTPSNDGVVADSLAATWPWAMGNLTYSPSGVGSDGRYYYPGGSTSEGGRARVFFELLADGIATGDTLHVPGGTGLESTRPAFYRMGPRDGRIVEGLNRVPFAATPSWSVTPRGTLVFADGRSARLHEVNVAGDTVRSIALDGPLRRPVPAAERSDSLQALRSRLDSLPVPVDEVMGLGAGVAELDLPETLPEVRGLGVASNGVVWVERWPLEGEGDARFYTVLDPLGDPIAQVALRAPLLSEPAPYFSERHVVGVLRDPRTDVHTVAVFELPATVIR